MEMGDGRRMDMRSLMRDVVDQHDLEALVVLGGDGTMRNALKLEDVGIKVLALPKTIDNDVTGTDVTFGFDTAMGIATEAIDRLHSTAHSHHRIILAEVMGHEVGWLALGAGLAGGADVILIPEIPYDIEAIASSIQARKAAGSAFSIIAVAEGAYSREDSTSEPRCSADMEGADGEERRDLKEKVTGPRQIGPDREARRRPRGGHRARVEGDDPRARAARRHALPRRPSPRHEAGDGHRFLYRRWRARSAGGGQRAIDRGGTSQEDRRDHQVRATRSSLGRLRPESGHRPRRLR